MKTEFWILMGVTAIITISHTRLNPDYQRLEKQFSYLARDFKEHISSK